ncbi:Non-specific serine/threonine protein kinase [Bertholletia excelsa]
MAGLANIFAIAILGAFLGLLPSSRAGKSEVEALLNWKSQSLGNQSIPLQLAWNIMQWSWKCDWNKPCLHWLTRYPSKLGFFCFSQLLRLDLKLNRLTGTIPTNIGLLSKLTYLDLSTNSLNGTVPLSLSNLTKVVELDLSRNGITGELDLRLFPDGSSQPKTGLISLERLLLQDTLLAGKLPAEMGNLKNLQLLALDNNRFNGPIPQSLGNLTKITFLHLNQNQFSGEIPVNFGALGQLTDLSLFSNHLSGAVPQEIGNLSSLVAFHLIDNNLTGYLPPQVCRGGKLRNFTAADNFFIGRIPVSLRNCTTLFRVRLENNQLTGNLDQDFGVYPNLTYIDLSQNRLRGKLSQNWGACKNLTLLNIAGNMVGGEIPDNIVQLSRLVELDLSSNQISGKIPTEIGNLSQLSSLSLKSNKIMGPIPEAIGGLLNLAHLDLSMNMLSGPIPDQIGDMPRLQFLSLSKNMLNGSIPYQIGNLVGLQTLLDLSYNSLSGGIPAQIGKLVSLESLSYAAFNDMISLTAIDLSYNELEGPLPITKAFNSSPPQAFASNKNLCGAVQVVGASIVLYRKAYQKNVPEDESPLRNAFSIWNYDVDIVFEDIINATKDFNNVYCIGVGSTAKVYKAELPSGQVVAVKRLSSNSESTEVEEVRSFANEIETLKEIRHRNIVKLYGFCSDGKHAFLVYEFVERGSLQKVLSNEKEAKELDWSKRVKIIKGVAYALSYMHHNCVPPIVHRDVSSKNILLDSDLEAHVSDFGTARFLKPNSSRWTTVAGTYGYIAPVLMGSHPGELLSSPAIGAIELKDLLDPRLSSPLVPKMFEGLSSVMKLALWCLRADPQSRPTMHAVTQLLEMKATVDDKQ